VFHGLNETDLSHISKYIEGKRISCQWAPFHYNRWTTGFASNILLQVIS